MLIAWLWRYIVYWINMKLNAIADLMCLPVRFIALWRLWIWFLLVVWIIFRSVDVLITCICLFDRLKLLPCRFCIFTVCCIRPCSGALIFSLFMIHVSYLLVVVFFTYVSAECKALGVIYQFWLHVERTRLLEVYIR